MSPLDNFSSIVFLEERHLMVMCHQNYLDQFFRFAVKCANLGMHAFTSSPGMDIPCSGETLRVVQVLQMAPF